MKKDIRIKIYVFFILLSGCSPGEESTFARRIVKDFNLAWWTEKHTQALFRNKAEGWGGSKVIPATVYAVGYTQDFIIAKRHPCIGGLLNPMDGYLLDKDSIYYQFVEKVSKENLSDTSYASDVFKHQGIWYQNIKTACPFKEVTYYYIIDIRQINTKEWYKNMLSRYIFEFKNESDFRKKCKKLGIASLQFTSIDKELVP